MSPRRLLVALAVALGLAGVSIAPALAGPAPAGPALAAGGPAAPANAYALVTIDQAVTFREEYVLAEDGSVSITQHITWQFPIGRERHGIDRLVKVRAGYRNEEERFRYYPMSQVSATSPTGAPTDVSVTDLGAFKRIRIGSPSRTVSGTQEYVVKFTLGKYVNDIGDGTAEFYWNTVDSSSFDTYQNVSASLQAPVAPTKVACFYGPRGSTEPCQATAGAVAEFAAPDVAPGAGVSVLASYPRDTFGDLTPDLRTGSVGNTDEGSLSPRVAGWTNQVLLGLGAFVPLLAAAGMGALVWARGRDEAYAGLTPGLTPGLGQQADVVRTASHGTIAVQFSPPAGVQPGMVGTVIDETANVVDVTGTLVDLAVRGYLTIGKVDGAARFKKDDWLLTRTQPPAGAVGLAGYEQMLLDGVFENGPEVHLSSLKNTFATTLTSVQRAMYDEVVARGWFRRSPESQRSGWTALGAVLIAAGALGLFYLAGWLSRMFGDGGHAGPYVLSAGLIVAGLVVRLMGRRMAARTADGSAVLVQSRGFEDYLKTAEASQIRWEEAQDVFSRYLPYAIVFGVAERWAAIFSEVAAAAAAAGQSIMPPIWYVGAWDPTIGFGQLASSMDDFSTTAAGTFVSTPGSSGSSGFSSGGGFSGGGGGGSSGGSW